MILPKSYVAHCPCLRFIGPKIVGKKRKKIHAAPKTLYVYDKNGVGSYQKGYGVTLKMV